MNFSEFFKASADNDSNNTIIWLCWMYFCWGVASSMVFTLLPFFIVDELGGDSKSLGFLEGGVIFLSFAVRLCAGFFIDIFKKKIPMIMTGTVLTICSKIAFACAFNFLFVFFAKAVDRFAKGLRQAPIDAMLAELSTKRGFAYSLKYMMDIAGALFGSVITSVLVRSYDKSFKLIFTFAVIPTIVALFILRHKIKYKDAKPTELKEKHKWNIRDVSMMPKEYWDFVIIVAILMFARFSESFISLRAREVLPGCMGDVPLFMSLYLICAVLVAIPIGKLSDRIDKRLILLYGVLILFATNIVALFASNYITVILIYLGAGIHMGATQGVLSSIIAKVAPKNLIGTAFAIFYGIEGGVLFCTNVMVGFSSKVAIGLGLQGSAGPFMMGAVSTSATMMYILYLLKRDSRLGRNS